MKKITLLALLLIHFLSAFGQNNTYDYTDANALIDIWLRSQKDYEDIPAIMGVAVKDQEVIWSGAFGESNVEAGNLADTNTICNIGSVSKVFTAKAIMKLVSEGQISLDEQIKDILPNYKLRQAFPDSGYVTIKSLLTHSSGVPRDTEHSYWSGPDHPFPSRVDFLDHLSDLETSFPIDSDVQYSNLGYALLGLVIEEVSGLTYKEYIESNIFHPLGMNDSFVEIPESLYGKKHAIGYTALNRDRVRYPASLFQTKALQPAAGISSTVSDLAKFAAWQFRLLKTEKKEILTPEILKSMYQIQASGKNGFNKRGYGYQVFNDKEGNSWAMHGGICPGFVAFLKMDVSNKKAYVILVNANGVKALRYVNGIIDILNKVEPNQIGEKKHPDFSEYEGYYDLSPWNSEYYIGPWNDGLVALYLPTESLEYSMYFYKHKEGAVFQLLNEQNEPTGEELIFYQNDKGIINKVKNDGNYHFRKKY